VEVEPDCTVPGHPEVFVLGDAAAYPDGKGGTLPGIAPVAIQMGQYCARTISGDIAGKPRAPFGYWDKGQLAVIGRGQAVAQVGNISFGGFFAWLIWVFVHIFFLIGFRNRLVVLFEWAIAYVTAQRGARVFSGGAEPPKTP
jgi:NADH dehydrogenase